MVGDTGIWGDILSGVSGAALQTIVLLCGVIGGLILYKKRREFKPRVRISMSGRIARPVGLPVQLFIRLHFVNESGGRTLVSSLAVVWSIATSANAYPTFEERSGDYPLDFVFGEVQPDTGVMAAPDGGIVKVRSMEPNQCLDTELLFSVDPFPELIGLRTVVEYQRVGRLFLFPWVEIPRDNKTWAAFAYIDPDLLAGREYVPLTSHESD